MESVRFTIGSVEFAAIRARGAKPHWVLHIVETGQVHGSGVGGISNESVPKMKASLVELLERVSKGDAADFRKRFGLPVSVVDPLPKFMVLDFGYAGIATDMGFKMSSVIHATADELLSKHSQDDVIFVQGAKIHGTPRTYEYARFDRAIAAGH